MSFGDGQVCLRNADRAPQAVIHGVGYDADAYGDIKCSCAACINSQHGPFSVVSMHSILHSFQWEPDFLEPFQASHRAIELRGQVFQKSWKDPVARLACFSICSFDQCVYGLDARKPTTLLLLRLNDFRNITLLRGHGGRCSHRHGHNPLQGINSEGSFNTARAKIYPKAMNAALAAAVTGFLVDRQMHSDKDQLPTELQQLVSSDFVDESTVQPDFHNH